MNRTLLLAIFAVALVAAAAPAHAEKRTWMQVLFPYFTKQPDLNADPGRTGIAPFAAGDIQTSSGAAAPANPLESLYATAADVSLDQPHLHQDEVSGWLIKAVSEILSLSPNDYDAHLKHLATGMDEEALTSFRTFIDTNQILAKLRDNRLKMNSFVEETPLLLNQGPVDGRYRWLFEVPVTLTFLSDSVHAYDKQDASLNQRVAIVVQVGRVPKGQGVNQMLIETFTMRSNNSPPAQ